jgi:hypothetical protein
MLWIPFVLSSLASPPAPIVNGAPTSDFLQVGAVVAYDSTYGSFPFCSGTLIHEFWILTAAHCIEEAEDYLQYGFEILFMVGDNLYTQEGIEDYDEIVSMVAHPDYGYSSSYLEHDIGMMELQTGLSWLEPIALNTQPPADDWQGAQLDYIGWGITGDSQNDSGMKRYAAIPYLDYDAQFIYALDTSGQTNLCSGDSGGAALLPDDVGGWTLAGVNSFVFGYYSNATACEGGGSGASRVDISIDFIESNFPVPSEALEPEEDLEEYVEEDVWADEEPDIPSPKISACSTRGGGLGLEGLLWLPGIAILFMRRRKKRSDSKHPLS